MDTNNPFKDLEAGAECPPGLKNQITSEIDLIRNSLQIVELYAYDIFTAFTHFLSGVVDQETNRNEINNG